MNKQTFLDGLDQALGDMEPNEKQDILYDYEEHIDAAVAAGETDEAVIMKLGSPEAVARPYRAGRVIQEAQPGRPTSVMRAVLASVGLGLFNIIFVLGPFFGIIGLFIGAYGITFGFVVSGIAMSFAAIWPPIMNIGTSAFADGSHVAFRIALLSGGIGIGCVGLLLGLGSYWLSKQFMRLTVGYLQMNVNIIKGPAERM